MSRLPRLAARACLLMLMTACAATPSPSVESTPSPEPTSPATPTATPTPEPTTTPTATPSVAGEPPPLALEPIADGLVNPISLATAPNGWLLVNEQAGRVVAVHPERGERAVVVDLTDRVLGGGERGLLGLVLHPEWPQVGRAWVHYTSRDTDAIVSELTGSQDGDAAPVLDAASERILLELPDPYPNHNGGQLAFGPDGHLWIGLGDGGAGGDPLGHGQDPSTLLGSILRLDVSEPGTYAIPSGNPFADGGGAPEVYLVGLRNPWRFSFDPATDLLWIADVGQNAFEEIDRIDPAESAGANLGWSIMEGAHCFSDPNCSADGLVLPLAEYGRELGCSVTGGHVYRGTAIDGLAGWYLFADYCTGLLFGVPSDAAAPAAGTALAPSVLLETGGNVSSFGIDADGELYLVDHGAGVLSRIAVGGR